MNLFDKNLKYLEDNEAALYEKVINYSTKTVDDEPTYELITEPNLNIKIQIGDKEYFYYSKYNPSYECERFIAALPILDKTDQGIVMYGLGLTYHLVTLLEAYPKKSIFIFEPEVGVFIEAMKVVDLEQLYNHPQVTYIKVGYDDENESIFSNYLYHFANFPIQLVDLPIYRTINPNQLVAFLKKIEQTSITKLFSQGFHKHFRNQMHINSLTNLKVIKSTPSLRQFKNKYQGCTMFIIGGGPSLQYDIEYIKQVQDDVFIVAAGSSVQGLVHYGIKPHLIVSMDPGRANYNVFKGGRYNDIPLLFYPQIHCDIVREHSKLNMYAVYANDELINQLVDTRKIDYVFDPTYSVTGTVVQLAKYVGAKRAVFTGQDLSYPGKKIYSPGANHYTDGTGKAEMSDNNLTETVPNVNGGENPTTFSMRKTLENIESNIENIPEVEFINASSQGAVIKGTTFMPMSEVIKLDFNTDYDYNELKTILSEYDGNYTNTELSDLNAVVREKLLAINQFSDRIKRVKNKLGKLKKLSKIDYFKAEKLLRDIEVSWSEILNESIFKTFIEEWIIVEIDIYDKRILLVNNEHELEKKVELVDLTVGSLINSINEKISLMKPLLKDLLNSYEAHE